MITVHKYPLGRGGIQVAMPHGALPLCVQLQQGQPCLWVEVDTAQPMVMRTFVFFGTGHPIPQDKPLKYVGTFQLEGGALVFHLYEVAETEVRVEAVAHRRLLES